MHRVNVEQAITRETRLQMEMHVENFLTRDLAVRLPQVQPFRREHAHDRLRDMHRALEQAGSGLRVKFVERGNMLFRYDQHMTGVRLAQVHKREGCVIFIDVAGLGFPADDVAENAVTHNDGVPAARAVRSY